MDNTSDFNGSEMQFNDTTVTGSTEVKDSPVRQYAWNMDHTDAMNVANIAPSDSCLDESTSHADGAILDGLIPPSPNASHNISSMSTASLPMGPPMASSTPAVKHASLRDSSDSARGKRPLKRKGQPPSPISGGSWSKRTKRRASPSTGNIYGGRELTDPEDGCTEQGEPEPGQGAPHTAEETKDLSIVLEEHSDTSLDHGAE